MNQVKADYGMLSEEEQAEIARRRLICAECPFNSKNAIKDGYETSRLDEHCTMCGCTITRKTASLSSACGLSCCNASNDSECTCKYPTLKKFNVDRNINMELKWDVYKKENHE